MKMNPTLIRVIFKLVLKRGSGVYIKDILCSWKDFFFNQNDNNVTEQNIKWIKLTPTLLSTSFKSMFYGHHYGMNNLHTNIFLPIYSELTLS